MNSPCPARPRPKSRMSRPFLPTPSTRVPSVGLIQQERPISRASTQSSLKSNHQTGSADMTEGCIPSLKKHNALSKGPKNKSALPKIQGRSSSRIISDTELPACKLPNRQGEVSNEALVQKKHPKASGLSQRNNTQLSTRSSSSLFTPGIANPERNEALNEDTRRIQRNLLHLHILHLTSTNVHLQWRDSALSHFHRLFEDLVGRHVEIADVAYQTQEFKNRSALVDWCRNLHPSEVERRVRTLSNCVEQVYENLNPGSKYHHIIGSFEVWFTQARKTQTTRQCRAIADVGNQCHVEEIGAGWQDDVDALQRRLSALIGDLRTLGSAPVSSNLGQLLVSLRDLVIDMLAEVDCIRSIEVELIAQEEAGIEERTKGLTLKVNDEIGENRKTPKGYHREPGKMK